MVSHSIYADISDRVLHFENGRGTLSFLKFPGAHCFAFILVFHASSPRVMDEQTQRLLRDSRDKPSTSFSHLSLGLTAVTRFARVLKTNTCLSTIQTFMLGELRFISRSFYKVEVRIYGGDSFYIFSNFTRAHSASAAGHRPEYSSLDLSNIWPRFHWRYFHVYYEFTLILRRSR